MNRPINSNSIMQYGNKSKQSFGKEVFLLSRNFFFLERKKEIMEIKEALAKLREEKKRKFDQTVDLIVNLRNFDVRKEALNTFIDIPNAQKKKVAAFVTKRYPGVDTITEEDFSKYNDLKDIKRLAKKYDAFIAAAPMMGKIATKFGRVFGPMNKMPSPQGGIIPQESSEAVQKMVERMDHVIRVRNKDMAIKLPVAKESMSDDKIEQNINAVIKGLEAKLPRGQDNIKEVLVKFTMTKPYLIMERKK